MVRDPERTKAKLLEAATAEFVEHGFGATRIDHIAERAGINKRMIYAYFGGKEQLFERVIHDSLVQLVDTVPITPGDLPGYAGRLFDYLVAHPERRRLALWRQLEGPTVTAEEIASTEAKHAAIEATIPPDERMPPAALLTIIAAVVSAWPPSSGPVLETQRATVVEAVRRLQRPLLPYAGHAD
ncbi:TetR family transcriptional regulator [Actinoplanes sp. NPDC000266]